MTTLPSSPKVSIIIPVHNDESYMARSLDSCMGQTLDDIEIICVDDKSTDGSVKVIGEYIARDPRVRLIKQRKNMSALQSRRIGIEAARADYIIFVDGDDSLATDTAKQTYTKAISTGADVVGFGTNLVTDKGRPAPKFESSLQPQFNELLGINIVKNLFNHDNTGNGHIWGYLFKRDLLVKAYQHISKTETAYRANDVMISFIALAHAQHYVSIDKKFYSYHFHSGSSGHEYIDYEKFLFYSRAIDSVDTIHRVLDMKNFNGDDLQIVQKSHRALRLHVIANVIQYCVNSLPEENHSQAIEYIIDKVGLQDTVLALSTARPRYLSKVKQYLPIKSVTRKSVNVAIFTADLGTGGLQGVVISQAKYLRDAGYDVTIVVRMDSKNAAHKLPDGVAYEKIVGANMPDKLLSLSDILQKRDIDTLIDHNVFYNHAWPFYCLIAKGLGVKAMGWIHSFSLRPAHDSNQLGSFLNNHISLLDGFVTLSKKDVAYWKILGHKNNIYYLPNPPSPLLLDNPPTHNPKKAPTDKLNLVWYGRLHQSTKRLLSLIEVADKLRRIDDKFCLRIVGPDSADFTSKDLEKRITELGLEDNVVVTGEKRGGELLQEIKDAHIFVMTSDIEGYPLVITEAQSFGLPVVMYDLPWLTIADNNTGLVQVPQGNAADMAKQINAIARDRRKYVDMSKGSISAAKQYLNHDFADLYDRLLSGRLPKEHSPSPTIDDARMFLEMHTIYQEKNARYSDRLSSSLKRRSSELNSIKTSTAYKTGLLIATPARRFKDMVRDVRNKRSL